MKKVIFKSLVLVGAILFAATFTSCDDEDPTYIVTFNSKGGEPTPPPQAVKEGGKVDRPENPQLKNHGFAGWSTADNATSPLWDFDRGTVTGNMTLYARWSADEFTVAFDSKGGTPTPQTQTVAQGGKVAKPADPALLYHDFVGWATADNATSPLWNFETGTVTGDLSLFARWEKQPDFTVTFNSNGGSAVAAQEVSPGEKATEPDPPTREDFRFVGWYKDNNRWDFATNVVTENITLYAKWDITALLVKHNTTWSGTTEFEYDDYNRLIKSTGLHNTYTFDYKSNGDMEISYSTTFGHIWTRTFTVTDNAVTFGDGAGGGGGGGYILTMELNSQGQPVKISETELFGGIWYRMQSKLSYQNGNLVKVEFIRDELAHGGDDFVFVEEATVTYEEYDNMKSPFYYSATPKWIIYMYIMDMFVGQNNLGVMTSSGTYNNWEMHLNDIKYDGKAGVPVMLKFGNDPEETFEYIYR